ncbi:MAG: nitrous oxide reductase family maturation protein NosD [Gammaproteobacteria bacterium]|nr:nitrous oxide reductase family maturation protein NosD [Gammaproteobacteria bacterium]
MAKIPLFHPLIKITKPLLFLVGLLFAGVGYCLPPFQLFIEITPEGGVLRPPAGHYAGPAVINKQLTIEGRGEVTIDGEGDGTVLTVLADGAVIKGLTLINSGESHNKVDAGILVSADRTVIENNTISNSLFGIHLRQANDKIIRNNRISSKDEVMSLRGDGLRLWYSQGNRIENNEFIAIRDLLFANSSENHIVGNTIKDSRMGMELVFSHDNKIINNKIDRNNRGIILIYSHAVDIRGNEISHLRDISGAAISVKGSSEAIIADNTILHCVIGLIANAPIHPEHIFILRDNLFAYNDVAMYFYGEKGGHKIYDNRFENNLTDVVVSGSSSALGNDWRGNHWDRYEGFDQNNDGYGDRPYSVYIYSDRLWMDRPMARFFRGAPSLAVLDFIERLAPFSEPELILSDPTPKIK